MASINFACKVFPIEKILRCAFGLSQTETEILRYLVNTQEEVEVETISREIGKDKTTVQRNVKTLAEKGVINRRQINLKQGGYVFVYSGKSKTFLKEKIYQSFDNFKETLAKEIQRW